MNLEEVLVLRLNSEDAKFRIGHVHPSDGHRNIFFSMRQNIIGGDSVIGRIEVDGNDVIVKIGRGQSIFHQLVFIKGISSVPRTWFPISLPTHKMVTYRFDIGDPKFPENVISLINDSIQTGLNLYTIYIQRSQGCSPMMRAALRNDEDD